MAGEGSSVCLPPVAGALWHREPPPGAKLCTSLLASDSPNNSSSTYRHKWRSTWQSWSPLRLFSCLRSCPSPWGDWEKSTGWGCAMPQASYLQRCTIKKKIIIFQWREKAARRRNRGRALDMFSPAAGWHSPVRCWTRAERLQEEPRRWAPASKNAILRRAAPRLHVAPRGPTWRLPVRWLGKTQRHGIRWFPMGSKQKNWFLLSCITREKQELNNLQPETG